MRLRIYPRLFAQSYCPAVPPLGNGTMGQQSPCAFCLGKSRSGPNLGGRLVQISMGCMVGADIYIAGTKYSIDSRSVL